MKIILILLSIYLNIYAYKVGDTISQETIKTLKIQENKLNIVDFFASWCISCKKELPLVNRLHQENKSNLHFIGVDTDSDIKKGIQFQKKLNLTFPVINDNEQKIVEAFEPIGMPALYFIEDNKVIKIIFGAVEHIDQKILDISNKK